MSATTTFAVVLGANESLPKPGGLVGFEHEYQLRAEGKPVDFRALIHLLGVPGQRLDPGDANAYRCSSGLALTCDDAEAELASPPLVLGPNFTTELDDWARSGRTLLNGLLPPHVDAIGYSTHLSTSVADACVDRVLQLFVDAFAPALMLVLDSPTSHGVFVRPRPSRLELCGDYAIGERLRAATAFFAGAVRACVMKVSGSGCSESALPAPLAVDALVALGRYGVEVDRRVAFGFDLYSEGRAANLPLRAGGTIDAQSYLESAWVSARTALIGYTDATDLEPAERVVSGSLPLGIEAARDEQDRRGAVCLPSSPFGTLLGQRQRGACIAEPLLATWHFTVFRLRRPGRTAYACVPRAYLARFLALLDAGKLDGLLAAHLKSPPTGSVLAAFVQTEAPGLWDDVGVPTDLLPTEPRASAEEPRALVGAAAAATSGLSPSVGPRVGKPADSGARYGKLPATREPRRHAPRRFESPPPQRPPPPATSPVPSQEPHGWSRRSIAVVAAVVVLVVLVGIAFAAGRRDNARAPRSNTTVSTVTTSVIVEQPSVPTTVGSVSTARRRLTVVPSTRVSVTPTATGPPTTSPPSPTTTVPATTSTSFRF